MSIHIVLGSGGTGKSYMVRQAVGLKVCPTNLQCGIVGGHTIYEITGCPVGRLTSNGYKA